MSHATTPRPSWTAIWRAAGALLAVLLLSAPLLLAADMERKQTTQPGLLPPEAARIAKPMPPVGDPGEKVVTPPPAAPSQRAQATDAYDQTLEISAAVDAVRNARATERALELWSNLALPCEVENWRHTTMGALHLRRGELEHAGEALYAALTRDPNNPVTHYYVGLLWLMHAERAPAWRELPFERSLHLVSLPRQAPADTRLTLPATDGAPERPPAVAPNTRAMFHFVAMSELRLAIAHAGRLPWEQTLGPAAEVMPADDEMLMPLVAPTVRDLLEALEADHFVARSHALLGRLELERGALAAAERHLDSAAAGGLATEDYLRLGKAWEEHEQKAAAVRVYQKAAAGEGEAAETAQKALNRLQAKPAPTVRM